MFGWHLSAFAIALEMFATLAPAAEIKVVGLAGMTPLMKELGPVFEIESGHRIVPRYGSIAAPLSRQLERSVGEFRSCKIR